jgi:hypothetical protein
MANESDPTADEVIYHGNLRKKGDKRRNWKERFFELRSDRLVYFTKGSVLSKAKLKGSLLLAPSSVVKREDTQRKALRKNATIRGKISCGFNVIGTDGKTLKLRVLHLAGDNEDAAEGWIKALETTVRSMHGRLPSVEHGAGWSAGGGAAGATHDDSDDDDNDDDDDAEAGGGAGVDRNATIAPVPASGESGSLLRAQKSPRANPKRMGGLESPATPVLAGGPRLHRRTDSCSSVTDPPLYPGVPPLPSPSARPNARPNEPSREAFGSPTSPYGAWGGRGDGEGDGEDGEDGDAGQPQPSSLEASPGSPGSPGSPRISPFKGARPLPPPQSYGGRAEGDERRSFIAPALSSRGSRESRGSEEGNGGGGGRGGVGGESNERIGHERERMDTSSAYSEAAMYAEIAAAKAAGAAGAAGAVGRAPQLPIPSIPSSPREVEQPPRQPPIPDVPQAPSGAPMDDDSSGIDSSGGEDGGGGGAGTDPRDVPEVDDDWLVGAGRNIPLDDVYAFDAALAVSKALTPPQKTRSLEGRGSGKPVAAKKLFVLSSPKSLRGSHVSSSIKNLSRNMYAAKLSKKPTPAQAAWSAAKTGRVQIPVASEPSPAEKLALQAKAMWGYQRHTNLTNQHQQQQPPQPQHQQQQQQHHHQSQQSQQSHPRQSPPGSVGSWEGGAAMRRPGGEDEEYHVAPVGAMGHHGRTQSVVYREVQVMQIRRQHLREGGP